jgi:4-amino-4-deoxy-L-arabinose transferase-like glycosyltransferase
MTRDPVNRIDIAIIAACVALFAAASLPIAGSMTDDTFIHMQYARNLAETGELSFNRGDPSYGATSPLWVGMLALVYLAGGELATWIRIFSWAAGALSVLVIYFFVLKLDGRRLVAGAAAAVLACEAWLLRWSSTGMESSFSLLAVLVCLFAALTATRSTGRSALFGLLLFLACLARPEAGLMVPVAFVSFLVAERSTPLGRRFTWLPVFAVLMAAWLLVIRAHTGTFLPLTAGAKQGRPAFGMEMLTSALVPLKIIGATLLLPAIAAVIFTALGIFRDRTLLEERGGLSRAGLLLLLLWVFLLPAVYVIFDFHVLSRYLLPVLPAIIAVGFVGTGRLLRTSSMKTTRILIVILAAVTMIQSLTFYFTVAVRPTKEFSKGLSEVLVPMGNWLAENSPPGSVVASPDIGAIGYFSKREVLDLGGLVTPEINDMRRRIDVERIIDEGLYLYLGADYLVDRHQEPRRFDGAVIRGIRFTALRDGVVSNLGIRKPDPVTYTLYRLDPDGEVLE